MDERTGQITALDELSRRMREGDTEDRLRAMRESENYVEIPGAELEQVQNMNRHERRKWAAQKRSAQRAAAKLSVRA